MEGLLNVNALLTSFFFTSSSTPKEDSRHPITACSGNASADSLEPLKMPYSYSNTSLLSLTQLVRIIQVICHPKVGHELQKGGIYWGNGTRREMRHVTIRNGG